MPNKNDETHLSSDRPLVEQPPDSPRFPAAGRFPRPGVKLTNYQRAVLEFIILVLVVWSLRVEPCQDITKGER